MTSQHRSKQHARPSDAAEARANEIADAGVSTPHCTHRYRV